MKLMLLVAAALLSLHHAAEAKVAKRNKIWEIVDEAAAALDIPRDVFRAVIDIESSGNPNRKTGKYRGLGQLSKEEFRKFGGQGNIMDPRQNAYATARGWKAKIENFQSKYGTTPSAADIYLIHQQGEGGYKAHTSNPDRPAWESMYSTREGQMRGKAWAKKAIWGNLTPEARRRYKNVNNITSGQFTQFWADRTNKIIAKHRNAPTGVPPMPEQKQQRLGPTNGGSTSKPIEKQLPQTKSVHDYGDGTASTRNADGTLTGSAKGIAFERLSKEDSDFYRQYLGPEIPIRRRDAGVKYDSRLPQGDEEVAPTSPDIPERSPGYRPPLPGRRPREAGYDPVAEKAFGSPFGQLYSNDGELPGKIPLLRDFLGPMISGDVDANASSPVVDNERRKEPIGRQVLRSIFKF